MNTFAYHREECLFASNRHCCHTPAAARCLLEVLHDQVLFSDMVESPGSSVPIEAVERNGLQRGMCIISWEHRVSLKPVRVGFPPLSICRAQAELEHSLKSSAEILIEETVDDGVDTAIEEG